MEAKNRVRTDGFTLIELLVVIAIVALLISVLIPALQSAKEYATLAACLTNEKSVVRGWYLYIEENESWIPGGAITWDRRLDGTSQASGDAVNYPPIWVWPPHTANGAYIGGNADLATREDRIRGCQKGSLSPYLESHKVYHCPGDKALAKPSPENRYRSYSIQAGAAVYSIDGSEIRKYNEISTPGSKYVFVEESYNGTAANYNHNSWDFEPWERDFHDPLALYHNDQATFGFADGHSERRKWRDSRTVSFFEDRYQWADWGGADLCGGNEDLEWLIMHCAYKKR